MRTLLLSLLSLATLSISAQQRDERVRDYLPPVRIVWMQGDISGQDNLLEPSDGQSEMSSRHLCRMKSFPRAATGHPVGLRARNPRGNPPGNRDACFAKTGKRTHPPG